MLTKRSSIRCFQRTRVLVALITILGSIFSVMIWIYFINENGNTFWTYNFPIEVKQKGSSDSWTSNFPIEVKQKVSSDSWTSNFPIEVKQKGSSDSWTSNFPIEVKQKGSSDSWTSNFPIEVKQKGSSDFSTSNFPIEVKQKGSSDSLLILIWSPQTLKDWNNYPKSRRTDYPKTCSRHCYFTANRKLINEADAIVVFAVGIDINESILPPVKKSWKNQLRFFWLTEAPPFMNKTSTFIQFPKDDGYNWTMTYRRDSDVILSYSYLNRMTTESDQQEQFALVQPIPEEKLESLKSRFLYGKTRLVAWTVSHCETVSKREDVAEKLKTYLLPKSVDIYGSCGTKNCSTVDSRFGGHWDSCYKELGVKYKFYLSFENGLCHDYVTEKFYYALEAGMVPIVYGGANYSHYGPPGSFIQVEDFPSVKELAEYLKYLDENPEEYLKYFLWKDKYIIYRKDKLCRLCEKMWEHSVVEHVQLEGQEGIGVRVIDPQYKKSYENISTWWNYIPTEESSKSLLKPNKFVCRPPPQFK